MMCGITSNILDMEDISNNKGTTGLSIHTCCTCFITLT